MTFDRGDFFCSLVRRHSHMRSWHDYHLTCNAVDGEPKQVSFKLSWPYETEAETKRAVVVFAKVEGYFFEHDLGGNILYSIEEASLESFLLQNTPFSLSNRNGVGRCFGKAALKKPRNI